RKACIKHQRADTLGISSGKQQAHRAALRDPEQSRTLGADRIHDRPNVVHAVFKIGDACDTVRQPGTPLVEPDQTRETGQAGKKKCPARNFKIAIAVGDKTGHKDQVEGAAPRYLVGDAYVSALGVPGLRGSHLSASSGVPAWWSRHSQQRITQSSCGGAAAVRISSGRPDALDLR